MRVLSGRGAVELWSGRLDEAVRVLEAGLAAQAASVGEDEPADGRGLLALAEALLGRLRRAAELATQATAHATGSSRPLDHNPHPAALSVWRFAEHFTADGAVLAVARSASP